MPEKLKTNTQVFLTLIPTLLWAVLFACRHFWYHPWCAEEPTPCVTSAVSALDQISFRFHSVGADFASNCVQNGLALIAFALPVWIFKSFKRAQSICFYLLQMTLWNGALLEAIRAVVQRPRPLVFNNPMGDGANIAQYTSFYSGHTSFVTLAGLGTFLWISRAYPQSRLRWFVLLTAFLLSVLTGALRIFGGRHFPTDVIAGALAGVWVALAVYAVYRRMLPMAADLYSSDSM